MSSELNRALNDTYTLWFHSSSDQDWSIDSYHEIFNFNTVDEFWTLFMSINTHPKMITNGMFFVMKQGVKPIWEDPNNINGGCFTWKIEKDDVVASWENMCALLVSGALDMLSEYGINGVSISPKKTNNILKIWLSQNPAQTVIDNLQMPSVCVFKEAQRLYKSNAALASGDN